jgi:hypothetical protein
VAISKLRDEASLTPRRFHSCAERSPPLMIPHVVPNFLLVESDGGKAQGGNRDLPSPHVLCDT